MGCVQRPHQRPLLEANACPAAFCCFVLFVLLCRWASPLASGSASVLQVCSLLLLALSVTVNSALRDEGQPPLPVQMSGAEVCGSAWHYLCALAPQWRSTAGVPEGQAAGIVGIVLPPRGAGCWGAGCSGELGLGREVLFGQDLRAHIPTGQRARVSEGLGARDRGCLQQAVGSPLP